LFVIVKAVAEVLVVAFDVGAMFAIFVVECRSISSPWFIVNSEMQQLEIQFKWLSSTSWLSAVIGNRAGDMPNPASRAE
jgi:hypothetical protein